MRYLEQKGYAPVERNYQTRHGELSASYGRGDDFCGGGYYHGATEAVVAQSGAEKMLEEADALCADLREDRGNSYHHLNCVHGLGHGFMGVLGTSCSRRSRRATRWRTGGRGNNVTAGCSCRT